MPAQLKTGVSSINDFLVLADSQSDSEVIVAPNRGAIVTSFKVAGRELLYLDEATLLDTSKNVRGGIPILFPSPGKLTDDHWQCDGHQGSMKQHGFARTCAWHVEASPAAAPTVTLSLSSDATTLAEYPWKFQILLTLTLKAHCLRMSFVVRNLDNCSMPYSLGIHPYFHVTDKLAARIDTHATRAFDNVSKKIGPFRGFNFAAPEVDLHLIDHGSSSSALHLGNDASIQVRASSDFSRWVVWSLADKPFICLEPWTAPGNALNTGEQLSVLAPQESRESWVEIEFVK